MPAFDVKIQGKTYHVEVPDPGASPLQVIVDGESFEVGIVGTESDAVPTPKPVQPPRPLPAPRPVSSPALVATIPMPLTTSGGDGGRDIAAPMPGTILSIQVAVGQSVEVGQVVCVLEAMKMKNPLRATQAGTITEILVQAGQTVSHGTVLIRLA